MQRLPGHVPRLLRRYEEGRLELDSLITERYSVAQVDDGCADQRDGTIIRGVLEHRH